MDTSYDISNEKDLRSLCSELGHDFELFQNLCRNNLSAREFNLISQRTGIRLTDSVGVINEAIDTAFRKGLILVVDKQYIDSEVVIEDVRTFINQFTAPLVGILSPNIIVSVTSLIEFIIQNCIVKSSERRLNNDVYNIRFPFRYNNMITIMIFKFKMVNVEKQSRLVIFNRYTYKAHISCISCVFAVDDELVLENEPEPHQSTHIVQLQA